ncbi:MAG: hypothetical protein PVI90_13645 [Desulfobacteraceae bacterium]|jgi:hypothetical protein
MVQNNRTVVILVTLIVAVIFQFIFVFVDGRDTPVKAAIEFSKDYFLLEETMADRLCSELSMDDDNNLAKEVITAATTEAHLRGFGLGMVRRSLSHIEAEVINEEEEKAEVKLSAASRVCINPVFAWVADLFNLGETKHEEAILSLVKEDDGWKVCGTPYFKTLTAEI